MRLSQVFKLLLATIAIVPSAYQVNAQSADSVVNNNNENVEIDVQESGSQQQGQSANGGSSQATLTDEDAPDNFWTNGYRGNLVIPPGSASLSCGEQSLYFSRSEGFGFGVGPVGLNFSDNAGQLPEEFNLGLAEIQNCLKEKNVAEILQQYLKLATQDQAIADTYLRTVSPEVYATLFVESAKNKGGLVSEQSFSGLSQDLRNEKFNQVVEWQDNFYGAALAEDRIILRKNQELKAIEREQRLAELEVINLDRKAREAEAILEYKQGELNKLLQQYKESK